jgi:hypothetical protein
MALFSAARPALEQRTAIVGAASLLLVGALLRLNHLLGARAFWYDELSVLDNLMGRGYADLSAPLSSDQVAPFGFLLVLKWFGEHLDFTEIAVRAPVAVASLIALGLFYVLVRRICSRATALLALLLFATNNWLIYYAAETKQYTFDVAAALLVYVIAIPLVSDWQRGRLISLALLGVVMVWFSHPVAFVLGAVGLVLIWQSFRARDYRHATELAGIGALWLVSFVAHLWFSSALGTDVTANQQDVYWADFFAPLPPTSASDVMWYWRALVGMFNMPLGFETAGLAAVAATAGAWAVWQRSPLVLAMLLLPLLITLLASWLRLYPFVSRLLLFLTPAALILVGEGMTLFAAWAWPRARVLCVVGLGIILFHPLGSTVRQAIAEQPYQREGLPEVLAFVRDHGEAGDWIHLYGSAEKSFQFYAPRYGLDVLPRSVVQRPGEDWDAYENSLQPLACKGRVWLVFAHITRQPIDHERLLLRSADRLGSRLMSVASSRESPLKDSLHEATAHLYELQGAGCGTLAAGRDSTGPEE